MKQEYLDNLNPKQKEAVTATEGPLLIIAGAGSGKTRVLTSRVAHILKSGLAEPFNIMAVTFTNKAAREMKERIESLLEGNTYGLTVSTFHSFCAMLLRREAPAIGYPTNFVIYDEDDAKALVKNCIDQLGLSRTQFTFQSVRRKISSAKNKMENAATFAQKASGYFETRTAEIYQMYERRLTECYAFDFDDLIFQAVRLLKENENIRLNYQNKLKYILVDEYQDTNHSQYSLLKFLIGPHHNICVVGDEDQSIYRWRGADISNILNFEKDFPGAKVIKLEQNYRSTRTILEAASAVIANNEARKGKILWTEIDQGDPVRLILNDTASDEAKSIIDAIESCRQKYMLKDMAILYRTNAQSRAFEEHLRRHNLPYQIFGSVSFYQRKEIKDVIAYLKLLANGKDDISFQRIVNYPKRGIGETSIVHLREFAAQKNISILEACGRLEECDQLGSRPKTLLAKFIDLVEPFIEQKNFVDIGTLIQQLVDKLGLPEILIEEDPVMGQSRVENIDEFIAAAVEFAASSTEPTLDNFLAEISLYTDLDKYDEIEDKLSLMTLHSAKGLEFMAIFMVGLEDGLFPLGRAIEDPLELEEERRLFYVGATRAKRNLFLSMAASRGRYGEMGAIPSRFIKELPPGLVETSDNRHYQPERSYNSYQSRPKPVQSGTSAKSGVYYEYEEEEILRPGCIVQHPTFGRGKVTGVEGAGESLRLDIYFTGVGQKRIMAKFARLKVVG